LFCCVLVWVFLLFVCFVLSLLMRQWQNFFPDTNTRTGGWRTNTKTIKTETLLHLNLGIFFFFSVLLSYFCLSNACIAHHWLVHYLSLFNTLALLCVCVCVCLLGWEIFSPFSLPNLLFLFSYSSTLKITMVIITR
jgi:hypothetical protein